MSKEIHNVLRMPGGRRAHVTVTGLLAALLLAAVSAACGSGDEATETPAADGRPTIVVTTTILGDVISEVIGDQAEVVTIMPVGADPHDFQASAREVDRLLSADALIVNGGGFEAGLVDVIDSARSEGVPTFEAIDAVDVIEFAGEGHDDDDHHDEDHSDDGDDHEEDEHDDGDHEEGEHDGDEHHEGVDPHFFTDPTRMATVLQGAVEFLAAEVERIDAVELDRSLDTYLAELDALDADVVALVDKVPADRRVLITNHEVFGYFADRYGFEVIGSVIPGGTTVESSSAGELVELARVIEREAVPAIFADQSSSSDLVDTLADEVGDVVVVELYSESLGEAGSDGATYLDMVRTNATRISAALS